MPHKLIPQLALIFMTLVLTACSGVQRNALPEQFKDEATIPGIPDARDWGHKPSPILQKDLVKSRQQSIQHDPEALTGKGEVNILALSGGGGDGAYGVGLLKGWSDSGTRPSFNLVTGISVGALIAPFAFLGSSHDRDITEIFTTISDEDIFTPKSVLLSLLSSDSLADSAPLANLIAKYVTQDFLDEVAKASAQGRRLFIGTTNLDRRRLMLWNMSTIASSRSPNALELFRKIMLASSSIPVAFPPVYFDVVAGGRHYDEMHVDGGVTTEVFFFGFTLDVKAALDEAGITKIPKRRIFIVRNSQIDPPYQQVEPGVFPIAERAMAGLTTSQGIGDLYRIYTITKDHDIEFNSAFIPRTFKATAKTPFDTKEMNRLFKLGYEQAKAGYPWEKFPPLYQMGPSKTKVSF